MASHFWTHKTEQDKEERKGDVEAHGTFGVRSTGRMLLFVLVDTARHVLHIDRGCKRHLS